MTPAYRKTTYSHGIVKDIYPAVPHPKDKLTILFEDGTYRVISQKDCPDISDVLFNRQHCIIEDDKYVVFMSEEVFNKTFTLTRDIPHA